MSEQTQLQYKEQRRSRRAKMAMPMRVRSSDPRDVHFEDQPISVNVSKEGIYFHTWRETYFKGMRGVRDLSFQFAARSLELRVRGRGCACRKAAEEQTGRSGAPHDDGELRLWRAPRLYLRRVKFKILMVRW